MIDSPDSSCILKRRHSRRILLIDDDEFVRQVYGRVLTRAQYATRTAPNVAVGLMIADEWRPDLILLDLAMPSTTGLEAAPLIKMHPATRAAILVAFSNYVGDGDTPVLRQLEFDSVLPKPHDANDLFKRLNWIFLTRAPGASES
jgi:CheY-like chemotaxis protein